MVGYPLVLPDMIGGNGYGEGLPPPGVESSIEGAPNEEIFLRWLQANTFMPSLQFSYVPWDYSQEVNEALFNASVFMALSQYQRLISFFLWL
jgi:myogenesis-regulating glycosidase